ncbi:MAG: hypothetical protein WBK20_09350 [Spirochaetota bacterium]
MMIVHFFKIKVDLDIYDIYNKLKPKIEKATFYIDIGFLKDKIEGNIDKEKNFFWIRRRGKTTNSFSPTFYGSIIELKGKKYINGYFYINPVFVLLYCIFVVLTYASFCDGINIHSLSMLTGIIIIGGISLYANIKDIRFIKKLLQSSVGSDQVVQQKYKNIIVLLTEVLILLLIIYGFLKS